MPKAVEIPLSKHFTQEQLDETHHYVYERLDATKRGLSSIHGEKIQAWRKIYAGTPRDKTKSFPWQYASNLVIQLVGSYCDQLTAKLIMGVIGIDPIWYLETVGSYPSRMRMDEQRTAIERWMAYQAFESTKLDLLTNYVVWARTFVRYGMGAIKLMPELEIEQVARRVQGKRKAEFTNFVRHDGPVIKPLQFEDFLIPAKIEPLHKSFVAQKSSMYKWDLEALMNDESYDKDAIEEILKQPDRNGPDANKRDQELVTGVQTASSEIADEWDLYECHYTRNVNGSTYRAITTIHHTTKKVIKSVFNWLPENTVPYIIARLGSDGERAYGYGYCEMLKDYQEEVSAIHNQRSDARTLANTNLIRIAAGLQADSNFSIYPNALFPGEKDSIEVIPLGRTGVDSIKDEQMVLQEAQDRAGVGPSSTGQGAGTVNRKGAYSAMGAFPVLQEGNTRANLNITEFRTAHYLVGRTCNLYDSTFGVSPKDIQALGSTGKFLEMALVSIRDHRIILPIRAATGSVNKEIEKQNLMLLLNNMRAHWQTIAQILQAAENPMAPPALKDYYINVILASNSLVKQIIRDFTTHDPSTFLPEPKGIREQSEAMDAQYEQQQQMQQQAQNQGGAQGEGASPTLPQPQAPGAPSAVSPYGNTQ